MDTDRNTNADRDTDVNRDTDTGNDRDKDTGKDTDTDRDTDTDMDTDRDRKTDHRHGHGHEQLQWITYKKNKGVESVNGTVARDFLWTPDSRPKIFLISISNSLRYSNSKVVPRGIIPRRKKKHFQDKGLFKHVYYKPWVV
jgi:hypothetical protein